jgi:hypothetical protein
VFRRQFDAARSLATPSLDDLQTLIDVERKLAETAFDEVLGQSTRDAHLFRESQRENLAENYFTCGLAQGPAHAAELIRAFEKQAAEQARAHGGQAI